MVRNFMGMLKVKWEEKKFVCVGLDPKIEKIPECVTAKTDASRLFLFGINIVDYTKETVCAYKPNIAFYAGFGPQGISALHKIIKYIKRVAPDVPVILDAKRADIGNTNFGYVEEAFDCFEADAITVNPYFGREALQPFLDKKDKGIIVLCKTSNQGAGEFQDFPGTSKLLYEQVAWNVTNQWNKNGNCALVTGATYTPDIAKIRRIIGDMPLLIPGIGTQGGDLLKTVQVGKNSQNTGIIINSSSGIIFASKGKDYAKVAGEKTRELNEQINKYRNGV